MGIKDYKKHSRQRGRRRQIIVGMLVLCLLLNYMNIHSIPAYAADDNPVSFDVGGGVTAILQAGVLTLSGQGNTNDYSAETAPFLAYANDIHTLVIPDGVTYIGAYLFYGLSGLGGELTLPGSITGFGDYAFSGVSIESAPAFTIIRNQFVSAEITEPVQPETEITDEMPAVSQAEDAGEPEITAAAADTASQEESDGTAGEDVTAAEAETVEDTSEDAANEHAPDEPEEPEEKEAAPETDIPAQDIPAQDIPAQDIPADSGQPENAVRTYTITQQEIAHPETLFAAGQTGFAIYTEDNMTFAASVQAAGYQVADASVKLTLDDRVEMELPLTEGQVCLPECPEEIRAEHGGDGFYDYEFAGWSTAQTGEAENALQTGQYLWTEGAEQISLYSVWNTIGKYQLKTKAVLADGAATYTLTDGDSEKELTAPEGYVFFYQWQTAEKTAEELNWTDIDGAEGPVYERAVEGEDVNRQFRCKVTAVKQTRTREAAEPVTLFSEGVDAAVEVTTVYVDQNKENDDTDEGTEASPFKSLTKAAEKLKEVNPDGTVETNKIVLLADYEMEGENSIQEKEKEGKIFSGTEVAASISGKTKEIELLGGAVTKDGKNHLSDVTIEISGNIKFENLTLQQNHHIYGNGNDITFGENVTSTATYLYGAERTPAGGKITKVGKINVQSGSFARIVGYSRSYTAPGGLKADNIEANITVNGGTVSTIISGSASGAVNNANVKINIKGGNATTIVGGNQGFSAAESPFTGSTVINVSGGKVTDIYGAGTGRNISIPTYQGDLTVNVSGGNIKNIYGAGSAAYVKSEDNGVQSNVNISATGGTIGNIFAAGKGNDLAVTGTFTSGGTTGTIGNKPFDFGSLSGEAKIEVGGQAVVTGNIYASGAGDSGGVSDYSGDGLKNNAYLNGNVTITINGGTIKGNIYGGGKGIDKPDYEECARVAEGSKVKVQIAGGTVEGSVFGGGENGKVKGNTDVTISGGTIIGNVYGGSKNAAVEGKTKVTISGGTVESSVYGGALGNAGTILVKKGATVNMTGGWVKGNLYGGSQISNDGSGTEDDTIDLIFVNLTGGVVSRNVFGGGYLGKVYGSTHVHIGSKAPEECSYYQGLGKEEAPDLSSSNLQVSGSVYAGGDFGGDGTDYNTITVTGTSHVYVDGEGYNTGAKDASGSEMTIQGGVFGSGASCDAGSTRLVTLDHYGAFEDGNTTRTLSAIQRADRVLLLHSHVRLSGQSDIANINQTALYSLNRIGDHDKVTDEQLGNLGRGLVLQGGSTVILDSEAIGLSRFSSVDTEGTPVEMSNVKNTLNRIQFDAGTVFRVAYTKAEESNLTYGAVTGYAYMKAGEMAEAFAYARMNEGEGSADGGFVDEERKEINSFAGENKVYRYWQMKTENAVSTRETVLTAREIKSGEAGYVDADYAVATGIIELPQTTKATTYTIQSVSIPTGSGLQLVEAARNDILESGTWVTSQSNHENNLGGVIQEAEEKQKILNNPLTNFGLFMTTGEGFESEGKMAGKVVSQKAAATGDSNTILNAKTGKSKDNVTPEIAFYLTYSNKNITASKDLGTVIIRLEGTEEDNTKTIIDMKVRIVTKAAALSNQTVELYATQGGNYSGKLTIPSGASRELKLTKVELPAGETGEGALIAYGSETFSGHQFGLNMQTVKPADWTKNDLSEPLDLYGFSQEVSIGTTDSRYDAELQFNLKNTPDFTAKEADSVVLTFTDQDNRTAEITLKINWQASIVSNVLVAGGREYTDAEPGGSAVTISPKSAVTSHFVIGTGGAVSDLWMELRDIDGSDSSAVALPEGTKLTLVAENEFYYYVVNGQEAKNKISLSSFKKMWADNTALTGNVTKDSTWTVITDFSTAGQSLAPGDYSLRLRDNTHADTQSDFFTVNNTSPTAAMTIAKEGQRYNFKLSALSTGDTRLKEGAFAVLSLKGGAAFAAGTEFSYTDGEKSYKLYPRGGKVYLPLPAQGNRVFTMDMANTAGLAAGTYEFCADIVPVGVNAGAKNGSLATDSQTLEVTAKPASALSVALASGERIVNPGSELTFKAAYEFSEASDKAIEVTMQKKREAGYTDIANSWTVSGNKGLSEASADIVVTVPDNTEQGTYRINFTLDGQQVPYNIIVE